MVRRLRVVGIGLLLGALFALWVAAAGMPPKGRFQAWACVVGGPVLGTAWGLAEFHTPICLGWLALLLIPAHPIRPSVGTGCLTVFGLVLWFFAGFVAILVAVA